jgi:hypothetical protein
MIRLMKQRYLYHQILPIVLFCIMIARYFDENYMNDSMSMRKIPCHTLTEKKEVTEVRWPTFTLPVAIAVVAEEQEQHLPLLSPRQLTTSSSPSSSSSSSSLLWQYTFIYDQCELGYFVPMMAMMIPNDLWSNTTRFRMIRTKSMGTMMTMTNATTTTTTTTTTIARVVHNNSICLPHMGIVVNRHCTIKVM